MLQREKECLDCYVKEGSKICIFLNQEERRERSRNSGRFVREGLEMISKKGRKRTAVVVWMRGTSENRNG